MKPSLTNRLHRTNRLRAIVAVALALAMTAAACGGDSDSDSDDTTTVPSDAQSETTVADDEDPGGEDPGGEEPGEGTEAGGPRDVGSMGAPSGEPLVLGLVNTDGPSGLSFPDIENYTRATADYLNEHGGFGDRPIEIELCEPDSSPESSQACAQELAGKNVEAVLLGLDLFPDYATYDASGIPVFGMLPLFPADYNANALYTNGGNANVTAQMTAVAVEHFGASTVGIISADNVGANGTEASVKASLDLAGITYVSVKGSDNETDAGFQTLIRNATADDPDLLVNLYDGTGCIGVMDARASVGLDTPVITTNLCATDDVFAAVGDDAEGWFFVASGAGPDNDEIAAQREALAPAIDVSVDEVPIGALGLGGLGSQALFTMAVLANSVAADGGEVTGQSMFDFGRASTDVALFPSGSTTEALLECGAAASYPSVCAFTASISQYAGDGKVEIVEGLEQVSAIDYLP
jgi:branched-chain amino acid transport system substrate-binding protein